MGEKVRRATVSLCLKKIPKAPLFLLGFIILQFCFLVLCCYKYHLTSAMFESDAASEILLAENLYKNETWILSHDWYYSTEIRVLHNQLVIAPLFAFTDNYNLIYTLSFGLTLAMILCAVYFCMRSFELSPSSSLTALLFFLIPYSFYRRYSPFSMALMNQFYSFFLLNQFLFLGMFQRFKKAGRKRSRIAFAVGLLIFSILLGTCGIRYALILFVPLIIVELAEIWQKRGNCSWSMKGYVLILFLGYLGGGIFLQPLVVGPVRRNGRLCF